MGDDALPRALHTGFEKLREPEVNQKAIVFTESRKTRDYLLQLSSGSQYKDEIVLFNGAGSDGQTDL